MFRIQWRDKAFASMYEAVDYVAQHNPYAAARLLERFFKTVDLLAFMPLMSPKHSKRENVRVCPVVEPYLIYYLVLEDENTIEIMDVIHGARGNRL